MKPLIRLAAYPFFWAGCILAITGATIISLTINNRTTFIKQEKQ